MTAIDLRLKGFRGVSGDIAIDSGMIGDRWAGITIVSGANAGQKSVGIEALRTLMTLETSSKPVTAYGAVKGECAPQVVAPGAKDALIAMRDRETGGKASVSYPALAIGSQGAIPSCHPVVIGAVDPLALNDRNWFELLLDMVGGDEVNEGHVIDWLTASGIGPESERVRAAERVCEVGWDQAADDYKRRMDDQRRAWEGVTGKKWGINVAATWRPDGDWNLGADLDELQAALAKLEGQQISRAGEIDALNKEVDALGFRRTAEQECRKAMEAAQTATMVAAQELQHRIDGPYRCPCCGEPAGPNPRSHEIAQAESTARVKWVEATAAVKRSREAREKLDAMPPSVSGEGAADPEAIERVRNHVAAIRANQAAQKAEAARAEAEAMWRALLPTGVRSELIQDAHGPLNAALTKIATTMFGDKTRLWLARPDLKFRLWYADAGYEGDARRVVAASDRHSSLIERCRIAMQLLAWKRIGGPMIAVDNLELLTALGPRMALLRTIAQTQAPALVVIAQDDPSAIKLGGPLVALYEVRDGEIKLLARREPDAKEEAA